jgi:NADPH-dependent 2,4-dienoyl-CoA reductase/sulfur reductase-like enzyme/rhodanese-related sulfurtransferase
VREIIIVGASAAGMRCACRLARLEPSSKITVLEARQSFSYAACGLPYVLSGDIAGAGPLLNTEYGLPRDADFFAGHKRVKVLAGHRVKAVDAGRRRLKAEGPEGPLELSWDDLVLATGARPLSLPRQPVHPRVGGFHVLEDLERLHGGLARGEIGSVALVGAGLVGCELAEAFTSLWGAEVVLIEAAPSPLPAALDADLAGCVAKHIRAQGVRLLLGSPVGAIEADDDGVTLQAGEESIRADAAVVAIGVEPAVELAATAGAELADCGAIAVDDRLATSVPAIWAVGDCAAVRHAVTGEHAYMPLGSLANRQGRTLANVLAGRDDRFPPIAGAVAVKIFDWNVAAVGSTAAEAGERARSVWISANDRAHYWPETKEIHLKLIYDAADGRILGAQAAGEGEAVRRIDVACAMIARGATVAELAHLEHAYAPAYAPAMEPLAVAAMVALNQDDGVEAIPPSRPSVTGGVLDVRLTDEATQRPAPGERVTRIPLGELSGRLEEIDDAVELVLCERGTRSAEAVRLLGHHGIHARYLGGGRRWLAAMADDGEGED